MTLTDRIAHIFRMAKRASTRTADTGRFVARGFALGVSQMVNVMGTTVSERLPKRTDADALKGDWAKLGGDMRRAVDTVQRGKR